MSRTIGKLIARCQIAASEMKGIREGAFRMNLLKNLRVFVPLRETFSVPVRPDSYYCHAFSKSEGFFPMTFRIKNRRSI